MTVRIVDIREVTKPIASPIRNAYIDFSKMTSSLVAVVTNVVRDGKTVVGYGFNSNGRYGQGGLIRERFAQRVLEADPKTLLDESGDNLDPHKVWATLMTNEKPGGHGERSVAVGTIDMAVWDAVAKIAGKPLFRLLAERHKREANPRVFVYAAGGYYYPGKDNSALRAEMRGYLDRGYNVVKMKIGGAPLEEDRQRIEAVLKEIGSGAQLAVDANGRFDLETGIAYAKMLRDQLLVVQNLARLAGKDAASGVENDGVVGDIERQLPVLLDQHDGLALILEPLDGAADVGHDQGRQPFRRFVEQQHARVSHQRAADCEHLLLAAGKRAGKLRVALLEPREQAKDTLNVPWLGGLALALPGDGEVFTHRQRWKDPAALRDEADAEPRNPLGAQAADGLAKQADVAFLRRQKADNGGNTGGLAGAVASQQGQYLAFAQGEANAV